jgi:hypothetical protein
MSGMSVAAMQAALNEAALIEAERERGGRRKRRAQDKEWVTPPYHTPVDMGRRLSDRSLKGLESVREVLPTSQHHDGSIHSIPDDEGSVSDVSAHHYSNHGGNLIGGRALYQDYSGHDTSRSADTSLSGSRHIHRYSNSSLANKLNPDWSVHSASAVSDLHSMGLSIHPSEESVHAKSVGGATGDSIFKR